MILRKNYSADSTAKQIQITHYIHIYTYKIYKSSQSDVYIY